MAFFDDRRFLLSHIRHSFITCDDTGMCEMVMLNETMPHREADEANARLLDNIDVEAKSELLDIAQSFDIVSDMEMIGAHRRRSNTAQRLERLKKEKKSQAKVKIIHWKDNVQPLTENDLAEIFPKKQLATCTEKAIKKSLLSAQIEKYPSIPSNPFNEFARFDGRVSEGAPTKRILIFLTMMPPDERAFPMEVVTLCSARVHELIGLICWLYTNDGKEPKLKPSVNHYCLRIAEETGEADPDFPSLNAKEPIAKFGFPQLALVEKSNEENENLAVTVHIEEMFSIIQVPNLQVTLQWILEQTFKKRKATFGKGLRYEFEKVKEPGYRLDMNTKLVDIDGREFRLITSEDVDRREEQIEEPIDVPGMYAIEAPLYKHYKVLAVNKLGRNADVQLGISGKKVEITPLPSKSSSKLWSWQPKAATYNVESIAECEVVKQSTEKSTFKLVYHTGSEFQSQKFEADRKIAEEIVKKLQCIMQMRSSSIRDDYVTLKEQRQQRRSSHIPGFS
ncbi:target of rapamycin complex 2 subunit MAPKAP1-like protein [Leptotrombidium deliense]|uniref:Target of rapamycin complex 2 subunit MAPKAP1 n=1 Tax=Leptotrombidium deliense TaxID=299467 RepID=A0A443SET2_9ACAR|nr:target of rapamycin complex 2 subunit MAPKAP1-like protein [Leptotrombidium deliense]